MIFSIRDMGALYIIILAIILNAEESYRIRGNIFFKQRFDDFVEEMFL